VLKSLQTGVRGVRAIARDIRGRPNTVSEALRRMKYFQHVEGGPFECLGCETVKPTRAAIALHWTRVHSGAVSGRKGGPIRHGTWAGYVAHKKHGIPIEGCGCQEAASRHGKAEHEAKMRDPERAAKERARNRDRMRRKRAKARGGED